MSTKTLRKRIALATVAALGAGILSATVANAANTLVANTIIAGGNANKAPGTGVVNPVGVANVMNIASKTTTDGTTGTLTARLTLTSIGLLSVGDLAGSATPTAGTTATATLLSSGKLVVYTTGNADGASMFSVTGGTITANNGALAYKADGTAIASNDSATLISAVITPNAGATSMTVKLNVTNDTNATAAGMIDGTYSGVLSGQINVTIASSSAAGVLSPAKSGVWYADDATTGGRTSDSTTTGVGTAEWASQQFLNVRARDAYGVSVGAGYLLQASATNGALVAITALVAGSPANSADYSTIDPDNTTVIVAAPSSKPLTTTVTVTWNGTVIGTKTFTFTGEVAKVTLSSATNGYTGNTNNNRATISYADAAGNAVYIQGNNTGAAGFAQDSSVINSVITGITQSTAPSDSNTAGKLTFTCGIAGSANLAVTYTNISGTVIKSNVLPVTCSGKAVSYTAAYDKSNYKPGDIATLTITFKDSKGNLAADQAVGDADNQTNVLPVISTSGVTKVGAALAADADKSTNGVISYTFMVGTSTGTFSNSIEFPQVGTNATAAGLTQKAVTATLTIADGSTSLNDVLKGIVALIASINKQIAALAKLVTKKK